MRTRIVTSLLVLLPLAAMAQTYKWVDENGRTHYGQTVPKQYEQKATRLSNEPPVVSEQDRQRAIERAARNKALLDELTARRLQANASGPAAGNGQSAPAASASASGALAGESACEAAQRKFRESQECFARFQLVNGAMKPEAFETCTAVPEPPSCGRGEF